MCGEGCYGGSCGGVEEVSFVPFVRVFCCYLEVEKMGILINLVRL